MNYTIKLNIGSLLSPVVGGGYISIDTDLYSLNNWSVSKVLDNERLIYREISEGTIRCKAELYDALKELYDNDEQKVEIQFFFDNFAVPEYEGILILWSTYNNNLYYADLNVKIIDKYSWIDEFGDLRIYATSLEWAVIIDGDTIYNEPSKRYNVVIKEPLSDNTIFEGSSYRLYDVVRNILLLLDNSLTFNEDSITEMLEFESDSLFVSGQINPFYHIYITLPKLMLVDSGQTPIYSDSTEVFWFTFNNVMAYLRNYGLYYKIESGIFYIYHISNSTQSLGTTGASDQTTYRDKNWSLEKDIETADIAKMYYERETRKACSEIFPDWYNDSLKFGRLKEFVNSKISIDYSDYDNIQDFYLGNSISEPPQLYELSSITRFFYLFCDIVNIPDNNGVLSSFSNNGYDSFSTVGTGVMTITASCTSSAECTSNIFTIDPYDLLNVSIGFQLNSGQLPFIEISGTIIDFTQLNTKQLTAGTYNLYAYLQNTGSRRIKIYNTAASDFIIIIQANQAAPKPFVNNIALPDGTNGVSNYPTAQSYIDEYIGVYRCPDKEATINGESVTLNDNQLEPIRQQIELLTPIEKTSEIEDYTLIKTDLGNMNFEKLTIFGDKSKFARLVVKR